MSGLFERANELGILSVGRQGEWKLQVGVPTSLPRNASDGASLGGAVKTLVWWAPRELIHAHGARIRVTAVDVASLYTLDIGDGTNDLSHTFQASGGDTAVEILEGLRDAVNNGVDLGTLGGATLSFVDNSPLGDTIVRNVGDWEADGVQVGDRLTLTGTANNDATVFTVAAVTTLTLTLIVADVVFVEAAQPVTAAIVQRPIVASVEDRNVPTTGVINTLVLTRAVEATIDAEVVDETADYTIAVSADLTGALEFDEDADGGTIKLYATAAGVSNAQTPKDAQWVKVNGGTFTALDFEGFLERADTPSLGRIFGKLISQTSPTTGATIATTLRFAPAILEGAAA